MGFFLILTICAQTMKLLYYKKNIFRDFVQRRELDARDGL